MKTLPAIINICDLSLQLGDTWIHRDLNLSIIQGEILAIVGGSGTGKSQLLRQMLALQQPTSGNIYIHQKDIFQLKPKQLNVLRKNWGVMFQESALFSSLTVAENIMFPLSKHTRLPKKFMRELASLKIALADLPASAANKYSAELSGGMLKRAALARALALDPGILFLDEPTAGLDPQTAGAFDELILNLQASLGLTIIMVTHDLDSLWHITDRVAFLGEQKVLCTAPMLELTQQTHPLINAYFSGPRARLAENIYNTQK